MSSPVPQQDTVPDLSYYNLIREDILALIPPKTTRVLDVGCGSGATGHAMKQLLGVQEVVGIELYSQVAEQAQAKIDRVIVGDIEQLSLEYPDGYFDCMVCADVLEHTRDPWAVLRSLRRYLHDEGVVVASLPNLRHLAPLLKIVCDRFEYSDFGILDKTHLRFFTRHTIMQLFTQTGYRIIHLQPKRSRSWKFRLLNICSLGLLRPFSVYQYLVIAQKYREQHLAKERGIQSSNTAGISAQELQSPQH